ncbi:unnamed protein product [Gongylonema pulchrum]|uniref:C3H1-type domain-containing protein n=1 Tax=Gongylonema pulchrum TaxID=637853 RepID=A0A183DA08_9BILA|nr:unnamed protein product [Gongylonema pulchrum]VDK51262.1 unnamed protein product [Gongylonema pulchrum]
MNISPLWADEAVFYCILFSENCSSWCCEQACPLSDIADILNKEEKAQLKDSNGGLQTFLKNQHQVFKVTKGTVAVRNWTEEGRRRVEGRRKASDCWFYKNHPNGCPLTADVCSYRH